MQRHFKWVAKKTISVNDLWHDRWFYALLKNFSKFAETFPFSRTFYSRDRSSRDCGCEFFRRRAKDVRWVSCAIWNFAEFASSTRVPTSLRFEIIRFHRHCHCHRRRSRRTDLAFWVWSIGSHWRLACARRAKFDVSCWVLRKRLGKCTPGWFLELGGWSWRCWKWRHRGTGQSVDAIILFRRNWYYLEIIDISSK